jgi:uncharacterized repeat protein (TIGR01451 family)
LLSFLRLGLALFIGGSAIVGVARSLSADDIFNVLWRGDSFPDQVAFARSVVLSGDPDHDLLFAIGGRSLATNSLAEVAFAPLAPDGTIGKWIATTSLPIPLRSHAVVSAQGKIYVLGGLSEGHLTDAVYCAQADVLGKISNWSRPSRLDHRLGQHAAVTIDGQIYLVGGNQGSTGITDSVVSATVGRDCSTPLKWVTASSLAISVCNHSAVVAEINGAKYLYVIGGLYYTPTKPLTDVTNIVQRAQVSAGGLSSWRKIGSIESLRGIQHLAAVVSGEYLYVIGGSSDTNAQTSLGTVYRSKILNNGDLGPWISSTFPISIHSHAAAVSSQGQIYVVGGKSNRTYLDSVYFTPLALFEKQSFPTGPVVTGDYITYTLVYTNNGLKQLDDLFVIDKIPSNTMIVRPPYSTGTQVIAWTIPLLPITGSGSVSFTVQVQPRFTEARSTASQVAKSVDKSILDAPNAVVIPALSGAPARAETPAPGETPVSPASAVPTPNDTPTSQSKPVSAGPNCTPTDTPTPTDTLTNTPTPTSTEPHTITPTLTRRPTCTHTPTDTPPPADTLTPTPVPGPALVTNSAWLCDGNFKWCITSNTTVNATHHVYLPIILKGATP